MKWRVPMQWTDKNVGKVTVAYNYGINLIERIPMAFDYVYQHQTENDYLTAGEGMGYVVADAMFKGFIGKEANPEYSHWTRYPREKGSPVERTLPDCDKEYIEYAEPYYRASKLDISGKLINCFTQLEEQLKKGEPVGKYRYVDIDTFLRLAAESGQGVKREEQPGD